MLKSPVKIGILAVFVNYILIPCIITGYIIGRGVTINNTTYVLFCLLSFIFITIIGILFSIKYKELIKLKYIIKFTFIFLTPLLLLILFILLVPVFNPVYNNDLYGWFALFAIIIIVSALGISFLNCIILFLSNWVSLYFIKSKEK